MARRPIYLTKVSYIIKVKEKKKKKHTYKKIHIAQT